MNQDTKIWLANPRSQPVEIEGEQVVAMAESVSEMEGKDPGAGGCRAAQHLMDEERQQLEVALLPHWDLFAA